MRLRMHLSPAISNTNASKSSYWRTLTLLVALAMTSIADIVSTSPALASEDGAGPIERDDRLYPLCSDLIPMWIWRKHLQSMSSVPTDLTSCATSCDFAKDLQGVSVTYKCIRGNVFSAR